MSRKKETAETTTKKTYRQPSIHLCGQVDGSARFQASPSPCRRQACTHMGRLDRLGWGDIAIREDRWVRRGETMQPGSPLAAALRGRRRGLRTSAASIGSPSYACGVNACVNARPARLSCLEGPTRRCGDSGRSGNRRKNACWRNSESPAEERILSAGSGRTRDGQSSYVLYIDIQCA